MVFIFNADSSIVFLVRQLEKTKFLFFTVFNQGAAAVRVRLSNNQESSSQPQSSDNLCGDDSDERQKSVRIACCSLAAVTAFLIYIFRRRRAALLAKCLIDQANEEESRRSDFLPRGSLKSRKGGRKESIALVFQTRRVSPLRLLSRLNRK